MLDPARDETFAGSAALQEWMLRYLDEDARTAEEGNVSGPLKAAMDVLRDLRNEVRLAVDHGGLRGASHRHHLDRWYTPMNAFLSIGPRPTGSSSWPRSSAPVCSGSSGPRCG